MVLQRMIRCMLLHVRVNKINMYAFLPHRVNCKLSMLLPTVVSFRNIFGQLALAIQNFPFSVAVQARRILSSLPQNPS